MVLSTKERQFLEAAAELAIRQRELEPLVSAALGRRAYDYWILGHGRDDPALDTIDLSEGGDWRFRFHGLEFDVQQIADGRSVRVDFGPGGILTFTPEGVGSFVVTTRPPWRTFPELKALLSGSVGYDYAMYVELSDALKNMGLINYVAPDLVDLVKKHTTLVPGRGYVLDVPLAERPQDENALILCDRLVLAQKGRDLLNSASG
jgi:hypothetical protein